jgi:hypothetical protein
VLAPVLRQLTVEFTAGEPHGFAWEPLSVRHNENGEFDFAGLEPGLYSLRASGEGYADFVVSNVRVRPGKTLQVVFSMQPAGFIILCQ